MVVEDPIATKVLNFLVKNRDKAFTAEEIGRRVKTSARNVSVKLNLLKRRGEVEHKRPYWCAKSDSNKARK